MTLVHEPTVACGTETSKSHGQTTLRGVFMTWSPVPGTAWVDTSLSHRSTNGRFTEWRSIATSWFLTGLGALSHALPVTCIFRRASRLTRSCRTWPRFFEAWCIGRVEQSLSRRTHPVMRFTSSPPATWWTVSLPTKGLQLKLVTPWRS